VSRGGSVLISGEEVDFHLWKYDEKNLQNAISRKSIRIDMVYLQLNNSPI
jgi:hypothetical protein